MPSSGARQWRYDCDCLPEVADERRTQEWQRMHSQVSKANAGYFISEGRLAADLDKSELRERVDQADGTLIACNVCGTLREVGQ